MKNKRIVLYYIFAFTGVFLIMLSCFEFVDEIFSGFGGGLLAIGVLRIIKEARYNRNVEYAKAVDINRSDERNIFLGEKARSINFSIMVLGLCVLVLVLSFSEMKLLANTCFYIECSALVIYFTVYLILRKKY